MKEITTSFIDGIVVNKVHGDVNFHDVMVYISENSHLWLDKNVLWDFEDFEFSSMHPDDLTLFIQKAGDLRKIRQGLKTALVASSDLGFGMLRMFSMMAEQTFSFTFEAFRSYSDALNWLEK